MEILVAGASGFLGSNLAAHLTGRGHTVVRLVRRPPRAAAGESQWDPATGLLDREQVARADAVVNLAGSPTAGNPHSGRWAQELRDSRVRGTGLLARAVAAAPEPPAFLAGNGISWYGDHGAEPVTEESDSRGAAFLTRVTRVWQEAARPAVEAGARVRVLRTAPVLDAAAPPLSLMRWAWWAGLGARVGDGRQHFPVVSLRDWVAAVTWLLEEDAGSGPVNLCCTRTPTNAEFTRALARALSRPAPLAVPATAVRLGAGRMAPELLGSINAVPRVLQQGGYPMHDPDVDAVLDAGLHRRRP